ncbi:MAG: primosomal protein N' [Gemmatimonadetes bacterium]|nr:primosomal protein N' [Gemmatimonadota bacterium]
MTAPRLAAVALPVPLFTTFTYAVPPALAARVVPGARVVVPLRGGREVGIVTALDATLPEGVAAKPIADAPDAEPALTPSLLELARWIAERYATPVGLVLRAMLPTALAQASRAAPAGRETAVVAIARAFPTLMERDAFFKRSPAQRGLYESLEGMGGHAALTHLTGQLGIARTVITALEKRGAVRITRHASMRDPFAVRDRARGGDDGGADGAARLVPTDAQRAAVNALVASEPGEIALLHGITGSGKTLVYIELLRHVLEVQGKGAIVLVPEIALTPQTVDRFRAAFGDKVAVLHSALSDGERLDAWRALRRGERRIAVGARSAVFAPIADLGAVIVDEEHEASYKQGEAPRYHARDVAIARGRHEGAVVVLGSATPSLETWRAAQEGRARLLTLPMRAGAGALPRVEVVNLAAPHAPTVDPVRVALSEPLERAIGDTLARGEQVILLLNRRGFASFVQCPACGWVAECPNCSISLTAHKAPARWVCHYCQHQEAPAEACPRCATPVLQMRGLGTQQVERLVGERFPRATVARMDVDTTSGKWAHVEILDRVGRGEVDILLGTQMIAKGLDFPNVTLVGVIDADVGINLPDFRSSERTFQLLAQVAGRAGRGAKVGRVIIQTRAPDHHAVRCAMTHDYASFVRQELAARTSPAYPPEVQLANVLLSGEGQDDVARAAQQAADWLARLLATKKVAGLALVGPAPCPIERVEGRWRWHLLVKATDAPALTRVGRYFAERFKPDAAGVRVTWDRDPVSLL